MLHSLAYAIAYTPGMTYSNSSTTGTITQVRSQRVGSRQSADPQSRPTPRVLKGPLFTDCLSANIWNIVRL